MRRVFYGWIVVAASATIVCVALGCLFALGVFLAPIERAMGWSRGAISTVALLNWIAMGLGSVFWGALSDRIGGCRAGGGGGVLPGPRPPAPGDARRRRDVYPPLQRLV